MKPLSDYEKGFIEASIDTDGSIGLSKKQQGIIVIELSFSNNSLEYLDKIKQMLNTTNKSVLKKGTKNYTVKVGVTTMKWLFPQIKLVVKENKRIVALKMMDIKNTYHSKGIKNPDEYRKKMYALMKDFYG